MALVRKKRWAPVVVALAVLGTAGCGGPDEVVDSVPAAARVENPFVGVKGYVNPKWRSNVLAEPGGDRVADAPTAVWLRRIATISGMNGEISLRQHLDNALAEGAGYVEVVLQNLPASNCEDIGSSVDSEIQLGELSRYRSEFVDPIAAIEADSKYAGLRIINIIEPGSLHDLVMEVSNEWCASVKAHGDYVGGIQYALGTLGAIPNVYNYLDISHHGVLGHEANMTSAVALYASTIQGATGGFGTVAGFVSNVGDYGATVEPFFQPSTMVGGVTVRQSKWVDWNSYVDEQGFANAWKTAMVGRGMSDKIGMIIDTSRNGWGGSSRPTRASTSTDVNTFVNASRIDRRASAQNWCNQSGAGLGERPQAVDANGIQAYVWIKPPGESDGASPLTEDTKGVESMCNPSYLVNGTTPTGALPNAPVSERWFSAEFQELMANAYPPLDSAPRSDTIPPSSPWNLKASNLTSISMTLSWSASTDNVGVVGYDVYRDGALVASVQVFSVTLPGPGDGTTAVYTVRARDAAGNRSLPSSALTVTVPCCGTPNPPSVPANVTASKVTYTGVTLSWTASTDEVGMGEYELFESGVIIGSTKSTQFEVTGLQPGSTHTFTVRAVNTQSMHSADSSPLTVTTLSITVPSAATNLSWSATEGTVTLCWDAPDSASQYRYLLLYGSLNLGEFGETCVTLIGFKVGTPYVFTVKTVDAAGNVSVASNQVTVLLGIPVDNTPPAAPTGLTGSVLSSSSVRLTWNPPTEDPDVVIYLVYSSGALLQTVVGSTSATVTKLTVGQSYTLTVKAVDTAGNYSSASNAVTLTPMAVDSAAPSNLRVSDRGSRLSAVVLSWDPPSAGEAVVGYEVHRTTPQRDYLVERTSITSAVVTVTGELNQIVVGTYYVNAIHAAGDLSPASGPIAVTFKVGGDPLPLNSIPEFKAIATTSTTATFTWSRTSSPCSIWYGVYSDNVLMALTAGTTATVSNLTAGKSYVSKVIARDGCSQAGVSASITIKPGATLDVTPPSTPSNLKVTANTGSGGTWLLSWSASTDDVGVVGYDLYCRTVYSSMIYLTTLDTTKTTTDVNYGSGTVCTVRARDAVGNSSYDSNSVTFP